MSEVEKLIAEIATRLMVAGVARSDLPVKSEYAHWCVVQAKLIVIESMA